MLKIFYIAMIIIFVFMFFGLYFTNLMYVTNQPMFLFSQSNQIGMGAGMFLLGLIGFFLGIFSTLLIVSLFHAKPKDFDEFDL